MAAAYRVVVSSVSCYNSVVVDRRVHKHAVHYCAGPCGALSQGLDCAVAHRGTCSELLVAPEPGPTDPNTYLHNIAAAAGVTYQVSATCHGKTHLSLDTSGSLERAGSIGNMSMGEESPPWRVKKTPSGGGSMGNLASATSLKDITGEAINLASGKLKEFSFDKLRLSTSSHVTFRKGRKVRPDSFSRRSTDLDIIYGHFSSVTANGFAANGPVNGTAAAASNDENLPPFIAVRGAGVEEAKAKGAAGSLSTITKVGGGSTGSLTSACSGSLDQGLNTVASLYLNTLGEENLIARLLEKTRAEGGAGGAGGEDIRACLDILLKCSEDLKKCTDIIKQCIRRKGPGGGGGPDDEGANPESIYRAVMTRLSSYLKRLPLELEGVGGLARLAGGQGGQGAPSGGHSELAELVNSLHSIQQGPFSPIFGHDQPPRYEDVVQSPPLPKSPSKPSSAPTPSACSASYSSTSSSNSSSSSSSPSRAESVNATKPSHLTNGLQRAPHHALSPPAFTHTASSSPSSSPTHSPRRHSPIPLYANTTPPATPMEALFIEEDADVGKSVEQPTPQTYASNRGAMDRRSQSQGRNGTVYAKDAHPSSPPHTLQTAFGTQSSAAGYGSSWDSTSSAAPKATPDVPYRNDDIDKLLMDLENLSQSMNHQREEEPPLPVKTRKMMTDGGAGKPAGPALVQPNSKMQSQAPTQKPATSHLFTNGSTSKVTQGAMPAPPQGEGRGGEEEDGALLLRILESIESFAQELVDSGAGSTGSSERSSGKEREVMRLLQDTMATAGRAETPPQNAQTAALPAAPPMNLPEAVPAVPPKHSHSNPPAAPPAPVPRTPVTHTPVPHTPVLHTPVPHTPVPHTPVPHTPVPHTPVPHTPAPPEPVSELLSLLLAQASTATPTATSIPIPPPLPEVTPKVQAEEAEPAAAQTSSPSPGAPPTPPVVLSALTALTADAAEPEASASVVVVALTPVAGRDAAAVAVGNPVAVRDTGSTLLIQQTPEVIRVSDRPVM